MVPVTGAHHKGIGGSYSVSTSSDALGAVRVLHALQPGSLVVRADSLLAQFVTGQDPDQRHHDSRDHPAIRLRWVLSGVSWFCRPDHGAGGADQWAGKMGQG